MFERLFSSRRRRIEKARRAEFEGDLARAATLWAEAGVPLEAARVLLSLSNAELDPKARLLLLARAVDFTGRPAPAGTARAGKEAEFSGGSTAGDLRDRALRERARILLELAKAGALAGALRHDLAQAATDLETLGEPVLAAEAFRLLGDEEGRARALVASGDVEELEFVLHQEVADQREGRELREGLSHAATLIESGERRRALETLEALHLRHANDAALRERLAWLRGARLMTPTIRIRTRVDVPTETTSELHLLGDSVRIGRSEGEIVVAHAALSRTHLRIERDARGTPQVVDLESRNGTFFRGIRVNAPLAVTGELDLRLGNEVALRVSPTDSGVRFSIGGREYVAALGPTRLGPPQNDWQLRRDADGWVTLRRGQAAYFGAIALGETSELLAGDAWSGDRSAPAILRVERE